jgi:hypothetical protein
MKTTLLSLLLVCFIQADSQPTYRYRTPRPYPNYPKPVIQPSYQQPAIQIALLLDVSGSMNGLIEQAKAQLWNLVLTTGRLRCGTNAPSVQIALYEYGRPSNSARKGFVRQLTPFTEDLDLISRLLFNIRIEGGQEYCGQAIYTSLQELRWSANPEHYKVIFIAGNEDFLQGTLHYSIACKLAERKNVVVNTIYCGDYRQGIRENWNLNAQCGNGSYSSINHNQRIEEMPTPYDDEIISLNQQLNQTYIGYGYRGKSAAMAQTEADRLNQNMSKSAAVKRTMAKSKKNVYKNTDWDMVDKASEDAEFLNKLDRNQLDPSLHNKSTAEIKTLVDEKAKARDRIQNEIAQKSRLREKYLKENRSSTIETNNLQSEMEKIILKQVEPFHFTLEE